MTDEDRYAKVCYERTYLAEVIARVDFALPLPNVNAKLPAPVRKEALRRFPIEEPRNVVARELQIGPEAGALHSSEREMVEWHFWGRRREKELVINESFMLVRYNQYTSYEGLQADFIALLKAIGESFPDVSGRRVGLRYVNKITNDRDPFDWSHEIASPLLGLFGFCQDRESLTRVFHVIELNDADHQLRFNFGVLNPDFPAPIRKREFVLDLDGYMAGLQDQREILATLDRAHRQIQYLFESSITDELRGRMHAR